MSDWNKNKNQPSDDDEDDDLSLDWLDDEFKKGQPDKSGGERTGLTGELPWLQGGTSESGEASDDDVDDLLNEWQTTKKGIQPNQRGDNTGLTGALDWQQPAEPGKATRDSTGLTGELPWLAGDESAPAEIDDEAALPDAIDEPAAPAAPDWLSGMDDEFAETGDETFDTGGAFADDDYEAAAEPGAAPDWLSGMDEDLAPEGEYADEEFSPDEYAPEETAAPAADIPDWLADMELPGESAGENIESGAEPEWMADLDQALPETETDLEIGSQPDWLPQDFEDSGEAQYGDKAYAEDSGYSEFADEGAYGEYETSDAGTTEGEYTGETEYADEEYAPEAEYTDDDNLFDDLPDFAEAGTELEPASELPGDFADFTADNAGNDENLFDDLPDFAEEGAELEPASELPGDFADFTTDDAGDDFDLDDIFAADESGADAVELEPAADASWLADAMPSDESGVPEEAAEADDFMASLDAVGSADDDEFGWLDDMEPAAEIADEEPAAAPGVADWLDDMELPEAAADEAPALEVDDDMGFDDLFGEDDEQPVVDTAYLRNMVGGDDKDEVDAWFNEEVPAAEDVEPDWLSSLEEMPEDDEPEPAHQARPEPTPPPQEEDLEFDLDRLLDIDTPAARPGMTAELTNTDLDRLFGDEQSQIPVSSPRSQMPDIEAILSQAQAEPVDPSELPEDKFDVPDWLREAAAGGTEAAGTSAAALIRRQKDRPLNDLDDRLQALHESGMSLAGEQEVKEDADSSRRLAAVLPGVKEGLARGDIRPGETPAPAVSQALEISLEQEQRAALLVSLLGAGAAGKALLDDQGKLQTEVKPQVERTARRSIFQRFAGTERAIITLLLAVAVFMPFFMSIDTGTGLSPVFPEGSAGESAYNRIAALPANALVLVAAEYGPAGAAELDDLTRILLTHIQQRGAHPVIVSTNPVGLLHADHLVAQLNGESTRSSAYYTIAYLPGSAIGLRNLAAAPQRLFATDVRGSATGLQIQSLNEFALMVIITDNADALRNWMEQVIPSASVPLVVASGYAAVPLVQPYVQSAAGGAPLLVGFSDAYTYTAILTGGIITPPPVETLPPTPTPVPTEPPTATAEIVPTDITPSPTTVLETPTEPPTSTPAATDTPAATATNTQPPTLTPSPTNTEPAVTVTPSPVPLIDVITVTSDSNVNVRSGSGTNFDIVGELSPGDRLRVLGYNNSQRQWVNIILPDGTEGWVAGFLVRIEQMPADQFEAQVAAPRRNAQPARPDTPRRNSNPRQNVEQGGEATAEPTTLILPTSVPTVSAAEFTPLQAAVIPNGAARRDAITLGTLAAVVVILAGNIYYIVRWLLTRDE